MSLAWRVLGLGLFALAAAACDDGVSFCTNRDDAGNCPELPDFNWDAGGGIDASTLPSDGSTSADAIVADGAVVVGDSATAMDAASDASGGDAALADGGALPTSYNVEDFCAAVYASARTWRDKLEQCCVGAMDDRSIFLESGLAYFDGSNGTESVEGCVNSLTGAVGANLTFVDAAAVACATKYASQFALPEATCPAGGYQIDIEESKLGKQAQDLVQLPECRAALVGKLALNAVCVGDFQCKDGLRCLGTSNGKNCRDPLGNGSTCNRSAECADGLMCVGPVGGVGRVCRPKAEPVSVTAACTYSIECEPGTFCDDNGTCRTPTARTICAP